MDRDGSEGVADGEVEGGVAAPFGMDDRPGLGVDGGVVGFHTEVEAQKEVSEVETEADSVGSGELFVEILEFENPVRLILIAADGPDVSGIHKQSPLKDPEKFRAIFHAKVEANVAALVDEVAH